VIVHLTRTLLHRHRAWSSSGASATSSNASFVTGILDRSGWDSASWIKGHGAPVNGTEPKHPGLANVFRAEFTWLAAAPVNSEKPPLAFVSGVGYFELYCNGAKLTDRMLDPGWTNFVKRAYYVTFDLSSKHTFLVLSSSAPL
jgi:alpha-L-rhamnosidase